MKVGELFEIPRYTKLIDICCRDRVVHSIVQFLEMLALAARAARVSLTDLDAVDRDGSVAAGIDCHVGIRDDDLVEPGYRACIWG